MDDIRVSEMTFLQLVARGEPNFSGRILFSGGHDLATVKLQQQHLLEMVVHLLEVGYLRVENDQLLRLVAAVRNDWRGGQGSDIHPHEWAFPRSGLEARLRGGGQSYNLFITFTGLRRIEELRESLRVDRILDSHGVLLDFRYYLPELRDALARTDVANVAVMTLDLDDFKDVNEKHGHFGGDEVMKEYMRIVRDHVGTHGRVFRRGGDEVCAVLLGFDLDRTHVLAETIRQAIQGMRVIYEERVMPAVTSCIGVAATPPSPRSPDLGKIADERQGRAKKRGKNCVVAEDSDLALGGAAS